MSKICERHWEKNKHWCENMTKPSECISRKMKMKLSIDICCLLDEKSEYVTYQKGDTALLEGDRSDNLYFIIAGIVRGYYIDDKGNDITKCFSRENEFFSSEGLRTEGPSTFTIECLEACKCIRMPYSLVNEIIDLNMAFREYFNRFYFREIGKLEQRAKNLIVMTAEERYIDFCRQFPDLYNRVDLKYIASYIGIRAASLSRIRKKFS